MKRIPKNTRELIVLVFLVLLCANKCWTHDCGNNPMKNAVLIAQTLDTSLDKVLTIMKGLDLAAYNNLDSRYKTFKGCMGSVESGYFRKRSWDYRKLREALGKQQAKSARARKSRATEDSRRLLGLQ
ncbi:uncharacterized protein LOC135482833 [Lineus longissimus]|uniref:uncharacterized protein LOC135482833 n=1 Tax=Lineus longissimus TaxID=88925 RepID=UPI002B4C4B89